MSSCRASTSAVRCLRSPGQSSSRSFSSTTTASLEMKNYNHWQYKAHLKPAVTLPLPLPTLYAQKVVLSDGSTFMAHTTAPTPAIIRLTRDVQNNPLYAPGSDSAGASEDEEGRVGKFRKRFEGMDFGAPSGSPDRPAEVGEGVAPAENDLSWMSEGGREEKAPEVKRKQAAPTKGKKK